MAAKPNDAGDDESSPLLARPTASFDTITPKKSKKSLGSSLESPPPASPVPTTSTPDSADPVTAAPAGPASATTPLASQHEAVKKADDEIAWSEPAGLGVRGQNDENLVIFRRAVGINSSLTSACNVRSLEEGRKHASGMYAACIKEQRENKIAFGLIRLFSSSFIRGGGLRHAG